MVIAIIYEIDIIHVQYAEKVWKIEFEMLTSAKLPSFLYLTVHNGHI